jgi:hypothetical protein
VGNEGDASPGKFRLFLGQLSTSALVHLVHVSFLLEIEDELTRRFEFAEVFGIALDLRLVHVFGEVYGDNVSEKELCVKEEGEESYLWPSLQNIEPLGQLRTKVRRW